VTSGWGEDPAWLESSTLEAPDETWMDSGAKAGTVVGAGLLEQALDH